MKYYALEKKENKAELYVFGSITAHPWREKDKDAYGLVKELSELEADEIDVHINSNGGAVSEGLAIYNVLKNNKAKVTTIAMVSRVLRRLLFLWQETKGL